MSASPHQMIVICTLDPSKASEFKHYVTHARPIFSEYGGRPVGQYATVASVHGESETTHLVVMEFPSAEAIHSVFADPAYQALVPARTAAFPRLQILIAKDFDPATLMAALP